SAPSSGTASGPATTGKPVGLAVGSDAGVRATVAVYRTDGSLDFTIAPFGDDYAGGARVARADVTGDGTPDVVVGSGGGVRARGRPRASAADLGSPSTTAGPSAPARTRPCW